MKHRHGHTHAAVGECVGSDTAVTPGTKVTHKKRPASLISLHRQRRAPQLVGVRHIAVRWRYPDLRYRRAHAVHLVRRVVDPAVPQNHRLALRRGDDGAAGGNRQPVRLDRDAVLVLLALGDRVFEALHRARRLAGLPARLAPGAADLQRQGRPAGHGHTGSEKVTSIPTVSPIL